MAREIRVSPDGDAVAIRGNADESEWNAWSVCHAVTGSFRARAAQVDGWEVIVAADE